MHERKKGGFIGRQHHYKRHNKLDNLFTKEKHFFSDVRGNFSGKMNHLNWVKKGNLSCLGTHYGINSKESLIDSFFKFFTFFLQ